MGKFLIVFVYVAVLMMGVSFDGTWQREDEMEISNDFITFSSGAN